MKVTVVIPNYNGEKYLEICLTSLWKQTEKNFRLIIVDNGSTDKSVLIIQKSIEMAGKYGYDASLVKLICLDCNEGFCSAVNRGIRESDTEYVLLLNNDTEVTENFVEESLHGIEKSPKVFSVSPKMIQYHNRNRLDNCGDCYTILGWAFARGMDYPINAYADEQRVFSACGGAAIYRRVVFDEIGLFDEQHFAYLEDVDVGYRANLYGYENCYNPKAQVYHIGSAVSGSKHNAFKVELSARNSIYVIYKNMPILQLLLNAIPLLCGILVKVLFFTKKGLGKYYLKGLREGIRSAKKCERVAYQSKHLRNYLWVEVQLIKNVFVYMREACRK